MAGATQMLTGVPPLVSVPVLGMLILLGTVYAAYATLRPVSQVADRVTLLAYVITAFLVKPDWGAVAHATLIPHMRWDSLYVTTMVAVLGTTISPYLFFWQASHEVEEKRRGAGAPWRQRRGASAHELDRRAARRHHRHAVLQPRHVLHHAHDRGDAARVRAARRSRPLARRPRRCVRWRSTAPICSSRSGLIGTGLLAVPVLAASPRSRSPRCSAGAAGLDLTPRRRRYFYMVFAGAVVAGWRSTLPARAHPHAVSLACSTGSWRRRCSCSSCWSGVTPPSWQAHERPLAQRAGLADHRAHVFSRRSPSSVTSR
jgi:hypothetical protein